MERKTRLEFVGEKAGYGAGLLILTTVAFFVLSRFGVVPEFLTYFNMIGAVFAVYVLVLVTKGLRK